MKQNVYRGCSRFGGTAVCALKVSAHCGARQLSTRSSIVDAMRPQEKLKSSVLNCQRNCVITGELCEKRKKSGRSFA